MSMALVRATLFLAVVAAMTVPTISAGIWLPPSSPAGLPVTVASRTPVATFTSVFHDKLLVEVQDNTCVDWYHAGMDFRAAETWNVPSKVDGRPVKVSRILSVLEGESAQAGPACVIVWKTGCVAPSCMGTIQGISHRGFAGAWSTAVDLPPGEYRVHVPAPLGYRLTLVADLVPAN